MYVFFSKKYEKMKKLFANKKLEPKHSVDQDTSKEHLHFTSIKKVLQENQSKSNFFERKQ